MGKIFPFQIIFEGFPEFLFTLFDLRIKNKYLCVWETKAFGGSFPWFLAGESIVYSFHAELVPLTWFSDE